MKAGRLVFFLFTALCWLSIPSKILQSICALFLLTYIISWLYSKHVERSIRVRRIVTDLRVQRFDRLEISLAVENASFLPVQACCVSDRAGILSVSADDGRELLALSGNETRLITYSVIGNQRGEYHLGPINIKGSDPLGLFPFEKNIASGARVLVRPARKESPLSIKDGIPQGNIHVRNSRYEDTSLCRSIREYTPGDELKRINWKASARFGKLFTNEFQDTLNCPIFVFLDLSTEHYRLHLRHANMESAIADAAALITEAEKRGQHCGFASNGTDEADGAFPLVPSGEARAQAILDILAKIGPSNREDEETKVHFARALSIRKKGGKFFLITPLESGEIAGEGHRFKKLGEFVYERY